MLTVAHTHVMPAVKTLTVAHKGKWSIRIPKDVIRWPLHVGFPSADTLDIQIRSTFYRASENLQKSGSSGAVRLKLFDRQAFANFPNNKVFAPPWHLLTCQIT